MKILLLSLLMLVSFNLHAAVSCTPMGTDMLLCVDSTTGQSYTIRTVPGGIVKTP